MANPYGFYPATYPGYYNPLAQQQAMQAPQMQMQQAPQQPQQVQNGGFVRVKNEKEVIDYPLAPGYTMTFIDENATHCYTKTMGFNQFERPRIEKYRLVKEDVAENAPQEAPSVPKVDLTPYALKKDFDPIWAEINAIKARLPEKTDEVKTDE